MQYDSWVFDAKGVFHSNVSLSRANVVPLFSRDEIGVVADGSPRWRWLLLCPHFTQYVRKSHRLGCGCLPLYVGAIVISQTQPLEEKTPSEKLWLLAGELLRDEGIEDVNSKQLATLMGQALTCVAVYSTVDPLDPRTIHHVMSCAEDAARDAHLHFMDQVKILISGDRAL